VEDIRRNTCKAQYLQEEAHPICLLPGIPGIKAGAGEQESFFDYLRIIIYATCIFTP
jgi:hypothetical protein